MRTLVVAFGLAVILLGIMSLVGLAASRNLAISSAPDASDLAEAMDISPADLVSASLGQSDGRGTGISDSKLSYFPTMNDTFAILSTGQADSVALPNDEGDRSTILDGLNNSARTDLVQLALQLRVPDNANCATIDFALYSEEHSEFTGTRYNDFFTAELGGTNLVVADTEILAPLNFAITPNGDMVSNEISFGLRSDTETTFDGGTALLKTQTPVTPGEVVELVFSIQDLEDSIYDSAVFLDNFRWSNQTNCESGAFVMTGLPSTCQLYAANNSSGNDSQIFSMNFTTLEPTIVSFGPVHSKANIQGVDIHPLTRELFISGGGDHGNGESQLYIVHPVSHKLILIGTIRDKTGNGFEDVVDLSFRPNGTLWGFAAKGHPTRRGLITIDPVTGIAELVERSNKPVEGLAWAPDGNHLWLATKNQLHVYTPNGSIKKAFTASNLPGNIKGLEFRPDGKLMVSMHFGGRVNIYVLDINNGEIVTIDSFETAKFKDVTALAWPDWCTDELPQITNTLVREVDNALPFLDDTGQGVQVSVPANTLSTLSRFSYIKIKTNTVPSDLGSTGHIFRLNLYQDGVQLHNSTFQPPLALRVDYDNADVANLDEDTLGLFYWDRERDQWLSAICDGLEYERHPEQNWLSTPVCHLTEFGLFGELRNPPPGDGGGIPQADTIYLPLIIKGEDSSKETVDPLEGN